MLRKKKTTSVKRSRRTKNERVLQLKVSSPRIVLFQTIKTLRKLLKTFVILAILGIGVWYAYKAIHKHFNDNEEFAVRFVPVTSFDGSETKVLSKNRVWELSGIDFKGTIFQADLNDVEEKLANRPEVIRAEVTRKLPHTIEIKLEERVPIAWLSSTSMGLAGRNPYKGVLLDEYGVAFRSHMGFWNIAKGLPVIELRTSKKSDFTLGQKMTNKDAPRALDFVKKLANIEMQGWAVDRVYVENYYTLNVVTTDGVQAQFSMYDHDIQLEKFVMARDHALDNGEELAWIDLRPRTNNPCRYKSGGAVEIERSYEVEQVEQQGDSGLDSTTRSILDRDS